MKNHLIWLDSTWDHDVGIDVIREPHPDHPLLGSAKTGAHHHGVRDANKCHHGLDEKDKGPFSPSLHLSGLFTYGLSNHLNEMLCRADMDEADGANESESNQEHQIAHQWETRRESQFVDGLVLW